MWRLRMMPLDMDIPSNFSPIDMFKLESGRLAFDWKVFLFCGNDCIVNIELVAMRYFSTNGYINFKRLISPGVTNKFSMIVKQVRTFL